MTYLESVPISLKDVLDPVNLWLFLIAIEGETVIYVLLTHEQGDSSESINWDFLVCIIAFEDASNLADSI